MTTEDLQKAYDEAMERAHKLQADKDAVLASYKEQLAQANDEAATAHTALRNALAVDGLADRPDAEAVAAKLGLDLHG